MLKFIVFALLVGITVGEAVLEVTDSDFDSVIADHDTILVMFYAPWCGHCKKLKPEFEQAASVLQSNEPPVALAKVDCTEGGKDTCGKYEVRGYPTVKIFKSGELLQEYNGPRDASGIVKHMKAQVGPASKELTKDTFQTFVSKDDAAIVGLFGENSGLEATFKKVADKLREKYRFGHTTDAALLEQHGSDVVAIVRPAHLKNTFEESVVTTDSTDRAQIETFIKKNVHGLVGHRKTENAADFKAPLIVAYYNVDYLKNVKGTNYWRNRVMKVAKAAGADAITFAVSHFNDFQHELEEYGRGYVSGEKPVICARDAKNDKFVMEQEFSMDALEKFIKDFQAGALTPYLKSEPVPDSNDGPVTVAVAKNFDEVVTNSDKDVLVEFYAPWCGHCKKLSPIFDELGDKMKNEEVSIVKMDATANDVPSAYDVKGFPTLYFVPKGGKPKRYEGGRELADFIKYLSAEATEELTGWTRAGKPNKQEL